MKAVEMAVAQEDSWRNIVIALIGGGQSSSSNHSTSAQRFSGTCAVRRHARLATLISAVLLDFPFW